jgi:hypothetical protein
MKNSLKPLHKWKQTPRGLSALSAVELLLAYGFASWAIDSGNLWLYLLTAIFLVGSLKNLLKLIASAVPKKNE